MPLHKFFVNCCGRVHWAGNCESVSEIFVLLAQWELGLFGETVLLRLCTLTAIVGKPKYESMENV